MIDGLEQALVAACARLELKPLDEPIRSWFRKSCGAPVQAGDGTRSWLKVSGIPAGTASRQREAEKASASITGVPKPSILNILDWTAHGVHWRALQMELSTSPPPSLLFPARQLPPISDAWIDALRQALAALAKIEAPRFYITPHDVTRDIRLRFGGGAPHQANEWRMAHGDLHWNNLTAPALMLLDWENWGRAPRGYDAAYLIANTGYEPALMRRLEAAFADELSTPSGRIAQLSVYAQMLGFIDAHLHDPLYRSRIEELARRALNNG